MKDKIESLTKNFTPFELNSINEEFLESSYKNIKFSMSQNNRYLIIQNNIYSSINYDDNIQKYHSPYFEKEPQNNKSGVVKLPPINISRVNQLQEFMDNAK